jgi:TatA/E family protein of Tat protein translocase
VIELLVLVVVLLIVFGTGRLPKAGETLGRTARSFREALRGTPRPGSAPGEDGRAGAAPEGRAEPK